MKNRVSILGGVLVLALAFYVGGCGGGGGGSSDSSGSTDAASASFGDFSKTPNLDISSYDPGTSASASLSNKMAVGKASVTLEEGDWSAAACRAANDKAMVYDMTKQLQFTKCMLGAFQSRYPSLLLSPGDTKFIRFQEIRDMGVMDFVTDPVKFCADNPTYCSTNVVRMHLGGASEPGLATMHMCSNGALKEEMYLTISGTEASPTWNGSMYHNESFSEGELSGGFAGKMDLTNLALKLEADGTYTPLSGTFDGHMSDNFGTARSAGGHMRLAVDFANSAFAFQSGFAFKDSFTRPDPSGSASQAVSMQGSDKVSAYWSTTYGCAQQSNTMIEPAMARWDFDPTSNAASETYFCFDRCANDGAGAEVASTSGTSCTATCDISAKPFQYGAGYYEVTANDTIGACESGKLPALFTEAEASAGTIAAQYAWDCNIPDGATVVDLTAEDMEYAMAGDKCGQYEPNKEMTKMIDCENRLGNYMYAINTTTTFPNLDGRWSVMIGSNGVKKIFVDIMPMEFSTDEDKVVLHGEGSLKAKTATFTLTEQKWSWKNGEQGVPVAYTCTGDITTAASSLTFTCTKAGVSYILVLTAQEAQQDYKMKPAEDDFCKDNPSDCSGGEGGDWCSTHPEDCGEFDNYCKEPANANKPECNDNFCYDNPMAPECHDFCAEAANANSPQCNPDFCATNPEAQECSGAGGFCETNPNAPECMVGMDVGKYGGEYAREDFTLCKWEEGGIPGFTHLSVWPMDLASNKYCLGNPNSCADYNQFIVNDGTNSWNIGAHLADPDPSNTYISALNYTLVGERAVNVVVTFRVDFGDNAGSCTKSYSISQPTL